MVVPGKPAIGIKRKEVVLGPCGSLLAITGRGDSTAFMDPLLKRVSPPNFEFT